MNSISTPSGDDNLAKMSGRWADFYALHAHLKTYGRKLRGPCPLHGGGGDNFEVDPQSGKWYCHSQCKEGGDVFKFLMKLEGVNYHGALERIEQWTGSGNTDTRRAIAQLERQRTIVCAKQVAVYDYRGELGELLFQVVKYDPKDFRQRRPDSSGGYIWNLNGVARVLYRLPEVLSAVKASEIVYVAEGEKDADRLLSLGLCATCNSGGAGKWLDDYSKSLHGANVVILPDNDQAGSNHARIVATSLYPVAAQVRILNLPGLPPKGDVYDYLDAGGSIDELKELMKQAPIWNPEEIGKDQIISEWMPQSRVPLWDRLIDLADVPPPPAELPYLLGPYLLKGCTHWLTGQTGLGKSTFAYNLATALAEGWELWEIPCTQQTVLYIDAESGDIGRSLKIDRLYGPGPKVSGRLFFARLPVNLPDELDELVQVVKENGVSLVIFDTARRCFSVRDENDNAEFYRRVVPCLDRLKTEGVATLTMGHPPKSGGSGARGAGAQEDAGDVNLTLTLHKGELSDNNAIIALKVTKNRILGIPPPLYLQRCGSDHFERVVAGESNAADQNVSVSQVVKCQRDILSVLEEAGEDGLPYRGFETLITSKGHSKSSFNRARKALDESNQIIRSDGSWRLDPFAVEI